EFRRPDGQLATADDLKTNPAISTQAAESAQDPFPKRYPTDEYHFQRVMRFNWYSNAALRTIRGWIGPSADEWVTPNILLWPASIIGYWLVMLAAACWAISRIRAIRRKRRAQKDQGPPQALRESTPVRTWTIRKDGHETHPGASTMLSRFTQRLRLVFRSHTAGPS